ncbi:hypothetical protein J4Q44_G00374900 [Coregonus suidteri]|uniref:Uncharacterized protein n=1 Tax=Coregonus suidteri TaxID=861788 RepID=A0AAN8KMA6_9TELE
MELHLEDKSSTAPEEVKGGPAFKINPRWLLVQQSDVLLGERDPSPDPGQHDCREGGFRPLPRHRCQPHQHLPASRGQNRAGYTVWQSSH